eukprot:6177060-Pleurochrysis_carterae.AAC.2
MLLALPTRLMLAHWYGAYSPRMNRRVRNRCRLAVFARISQNRLECPHRRMPHTDASSRLVLPHACLILAVLAGAAGATSEVWGASTSEVERARAAACGVDRGGGAFKARARAMEQSEAEAEIAPVLRSDGRRARERDWQKRESGRTRRREAQPYGTRFLACGTDELRVGREKSAAASASSDARRSAWSDRARGCSTPRGRACLLLHFSLLLPLVPHLLLPRLRTENKAADNALSGALDYTKSLRNALPSTKLPPNCADTWVRNQSSAQPCLVQS